MRSLFQGKKKKKTASETKLNCLPLRHVKIKRTGKRRPREKEGGMKSKGSYVWNGGRNKS